MEIDPKILEQVYQDNVETNQIYQQQADGSFVGGIDPEVAKDLGYNTPEEVAALARQVETLPQPQPEPEQVPAEPVTPPAPLRLYEKPGRSADVLNWYDQPLTRKELLHGMTPEDVARQNLKNQAGVAAARAALRDITSKK
jgi:hypothetical protein